MISIKYDFPPLARARRAPLVFLAGSGPLLLLLLHLRCSDFSSLLSVTPPFSLFLILSLSLFPSRLPRRGGNPGFNPFPYNFLPMHREKLARNTHAHARIQRPFSLTPSLPPYRSRSLARCGGHRLLDFIEFSSSARRHPVQTQIRQLTPLAWGIRN